jgi:hypothetical protein
MLEIVLQNAATNTTADTMGACDDFLEKPIARDTTPIAEVREI